MLLSLNTMGIPYSHSLYMLQPSHCTALQDHRTENGGCHIFCTLHKTWIGPPYHHLQKAEISKVQCSQITLGIKPIWTSIVTIPLLSNINDSQWLDRQDTRRLKIRLFIERRRLVELYIVLFVHIQQPHPVHIIYCMLEEFRLDDRDVRKTRWGDVHKAEKTRRVVSVTTEEAIESAMESE